MSSENSNSSIKEVKPEIAERNNNSSSNSEKFDKLKAAVFFTLVTGFGLLSGFGYSLSSVKREETKSSAKRNKVSSSAAASAAKHQHPHQQQQQRLLLDPESRELNNLYESGASLARRALFRATVYSVGGFSIFCYTVWKLSGATNFAEFRYKIGTLMPNLKKKKSAEGNEGRTEFENLTDLIQYVIDEDNKKKTTPIATTTTKQQEIKK